MQSSTLILSTQEVRSVVGLGDVIPIVSEAYSLLRENKANVVAPRSRGIVEKYSRPLLLQSGYVETEHGDFVNAKISGGGLGVIVLLDARTNYPLAVMDATYVSGLRTAANGALAAKYLARAEPAKVAILGSGLQARSGLMALTTVFPTISGATVYSATPAHRCEYADTMTRVVGFPVVAHSLPRSAIEGADIIYMTTRAQNPLLMEGEIANGTHLSCIGSNFELALGVIGQCKVVVDSIEDPLSRGKTETAIKAGLFRKEDIYCEMADLVTGLMPGRTDPEEVTLLDSSGIGILDTLVAATIYSRALKGSVGRRLHISPLERAEQYPYESSETAYTGP